MGMLIYLPNIFERAVAVKAAKEKAVQTQRNKSIERVCKKADDYWGKKDK